MENIFRIPNLALIISLLLLALSGIGSVCLGAANIPVNSIFDFIIQICFGDWGKSSLSDIQETIILEWRLPRFVLGALVGASLSVAGSGFQGVFRNPLADPFLLGSAAGAGLGATLIIVSGLDISFLFLGSVQFGAFLGALVAVLAAAIVSSSAGRTTASLLLSGVAVAAFLTACQTYVMQRNFVSIQEIYGWLIGRLLTSGWTEVGIMFPYFLVCFSVIYFFARELDLLRLSEDESKALGGHPLQTKIVVISCASLMTAVAVSVSGLIAFVGLVVPHVIRLAVGSSYRIIIPLSAIVGGAFLSSADTFARVIVAPAELPIGVITAFIGAPFFAIILRLSKGTI
tara:strand:+ start:92 stop:1123 length:1032 start_codon:yes stop_codon:yes gene_type:complete